MANKLIIEFYRILVAQDMGCRRPSQTYSDRMILLAFLWAVLNDRPTSWACNWQNAPEYWPFALIPDDTTVSRRMRSESMRKLLDDLLQHLNSASTPRFWYLIDAKPLPVSEYTHDPDARVGRGAGKMQKGYKMYTIIDDQHRIVALRIAPMNGDETTLAFRMLRDVPSGTSTAPSGYLLGDALYDSNRLYDWSAHRGFRLLAPRKRPGTGLGHCYQSPWRKQAIAIFESPWRTFATAVRRMRDDIDRYFGQLTNFAEGLKPLPSWVRRLHRVRNWVQGKVLIHSLKLHHA